MCFYFLVYSSLQFHLFLSLFLFYFHLIWQSLHSRNRCFFSFQLYDVQKQHSSTSLFPFPPFLHSISRSFHFTPLSTPHYGRLLPSISLALFHLNLAPPGRLEASSISVHSLSTASSNENLSFNSSLILTQTHLPATLPVRLPHNHALPTPAHTKPAITPSTPHT